MLFSVSQADAIQPPHNYQTTSIQSIREPFRYLVLIPDYFNNSNVFFLKEICSTYLAAKSLWTNP